MQQILAETVLGTNHTKYSRDKYLNTLKKEYNNVEIIKVNNDYLYIIPDELVTMTELAKSNYLTASLKQEINNVLNGTGNLRTEYRNAIISNYQQYYEFVQFSNNKGANRKLLLGNKREQKLEKFDGRILGNRRLPYAELGAYLIVKTLNDLNKTTTARADYTFVDENDVEHYIFTRFEWYKRVISNPNLLAEKLESGKLNTKVFTANEWIKINNSYLYAKKSFYRSRLGSFLNRCNKTYVLNDKERMVAQTYDDTELVSEFGYPLSDKVIVLDDSTRSAIVDYQNYLCKKLDIANHYYGMNGINKATKKYRYELGKFLKENYDIQYTWIALSIQRHETIDITDVIESFISNMQDVNNISGDVNRYVESDWNQSLINKIYNYSKTSYKFDLPYAYYETVLDYIAFSYLDEYYSLNTFDKKQAKYILNTYFKDDNSDIIIPDDLLDIGITKEDVIKQLEWKRLEYFDRLTSFSKLNHINELLNK